MVKINQLEIENVKRVKAVSLTPAPAGLTVIGGKNNQGKTSVLDAIAWALGGEKFRPTDAARSDSVVPPSLRVELSNGLVVERKGKNSELKVTDPSGRRGGQKLLDAFVGELSLDLPKFMESTSKEKADILLRIIGVGDKLSEIDRHIQSIYNDRRTIGQIADQKAKTAKELPEYPDAPTDLVSASKLIIEQQEILARNGENARLRANRDNLKIKYEMAQQAVMDAEERLNAMRETLGKVAEQYRTACDSAECAQDESTAELEENIRQVDKINAKVRTNLTKAKALEDAEEYGAKYKALSGKLEEERQKRFDLLKSADLPLPGLSVEDGELVYNGHPWDCMSGSDQLMVSCAVVRKLKPDCGFVLMDKLEQMDSDTLSEFAAWLENEGLQVIATRVSTGKECSIVISDGYAAQPAQQEPAKTWTKGVF